MPEAMIRGHVLAHTARYFLAESDQLASRRLQAALMELPEDQRTAIVLCDVEGLDYNEIATAMKTSLGTVKSRIARARLKMRDLLQREPELLPGRYRPEP